VRIAGSLLWDGEHRNPHNVGPKHPLDLRPKKAWEVHPIHDLGFRHRRRISNFFCAHRIMARTRLGAQTDPLQGASRPARGYKQTSLGMHGDLAGKSQKLRTPRPRRRAVTKPAKARPGFQIFSAVFAFSGRAKPA
jgi:hypothetical protein